MRNRDLIEALRGFPDHSVGVHAVVTDDDSPSSLVDAEGPVAEVKLGMVHGNPGVTLVADCELVVGTYRHRPTSLRGRWPRSPQSKHAKVTR